MLIVSGLGAVKTEKGGGGRDACHPPRGPPTTGYAASRVAAFVFAFAVPKAPPLAGLAALVLSAAVYGLLA
jgi:hypothetical protein